MIEQRQSKLRFTNEKKTEFFFLYSRFEYAQRFRISIINESTAWHHTWWESTFVIQGRWIGSTSPFLFLFFFFNLSAGSLLLLLGWHSIQFLQNTVYMLFPHLCSYFMTGIQFLVSWSPSKLNRLWALNSFKHSSNSVGPNAILL